jgi:hypothetical protein
MSGDQAGAGNYDIASAALGLLTATHADRLIGCRGLSLLSKFGVARIGEVLFA